MSPARDAMVAFLVVSGLLSFTRPARAASFQAIGDLPGGAFASIAWDVSGDGRTVVGESAAASGTEAFRWTAGGGIESLGIVDSDARGIDADGSVIVGTLNRGSNRPLAYRWENGAVEMLEPPPEVDPDFGTTYPRASWGYGVSADGSTVVGAAENNAFSGDPIYRYPIAFRDAGIVAPFGTTPSANYAGSSEGAFAASADGSVLAGTSAYFGDDGQAFRYANGIVQFFPSVISSGNAASADGRVIVGGTCVGLCEFVAFRWVDGGGTEILLDARGAQIRSEAHDISADGSIIVGFMEPSPSAMEAMVWTEHGGMVSLRSRLEAAGVQDALAGWTQTRARGVSANGAVIVGDGINPAGQREGWIAVIPEPSVASMLALGLVLLSRGDRVWRRRR